jgi:ketosteroid isomerase-like protein
MNDAIDNAIQIESVVSSYFEALSAMDRGAWQALFAEDGLICDPVGSEPKLIAEASEQFFNILQKFYQHLSVTPVAVFVAGSGAAAHWQMQVTSQQQRQGQASGISVFELNEQGKLQKVSSYWNEGDLMRQLKPDVSLDQP